MRLSVGRGCAACACRDEFVYNRNFSMWSEYDGRFDIEERSPYTAHRVRMMRNQREAYMDRWNQKFMTEKGALNQYDGNPFT